MSDKGADTGSLIISYLWSRRGQALAAELGLALQRADISTACADLERRAWVDMVHEELPAVRLTQEALQALTAHVNFGTALPERLERAAEREARLREAQATSTVEMATMLRELRAEQVETRRLMIELAKAKGLPGGAAAPQIEVNTKCACGHLFFPGLKDECGRCGKAR